MCVGMCVIRAHGPRSTSPQGGPRSHSWDTVKVSLLSYKKFDWFMQTNPRGLKFNVRVGEEFTIVGNPNKRNKLSNALVMKVGNAKMKIATNCAAHIGIGDQFGPVVVTAWTNFKKDSCAIRSAFASAQDSNTALSAAGSGNASEGMSSVAIVGIVVGVLAGVVIVAAAIIIRRRKAANGNWATASSQE